MGAWDSLPASGILAAIPATLFAWEETRLQVPRLRERFENVVRLSEIIQVLISNGFSHLLGTSGLLDHLPQGIRPEPEAKEGPSPPPDPETLGRRLREVFLELGPTFIKLGQILATRADLLEDEVRFELEKLQDRTPAIPFETMREVIREDLGKDPEAIFKELDPVPIACASIGQVYRARLPDGRAVAVKVQKPGLPKIIESDLNLLRALAEWWIESQGNLGFTDPTTTIEELRRSLMRELDYTNERRTAERFRQNFSDRPEVFIPRVHAEQSARRVLTLDWVDGVRLDQVAAYPDRRSDPAKVARIGCDAVCRQIFSHRFFHADPHPGNLVLLHNDRVGVLDFGMVGHLSQGDVFAMADLARAVLSDDEEACTRILLGFTVSGYTEDPHALSHEISELLAFEAQGLIQEGRIGEAIQALASLLRRHRLELAPRFSLLLKALATVESTAHSLDPNLDMVPLVRPHLEGLLRERFSPTGLSELAQDEGLRLARLARQLPEDVHSILLRLRQGKLHLDLDLKRIDHLSEVLDRSSARLSFSIIVSALILGSSWLLSSKPVADRLGLAGYVLAALLAIGVTVSTLRSTPR